MESFLSKQSRDSREAVLARARERLDRADSQKQSRDSREQLCYLGPADGYIRSNQEIVEKLSRLEMWRGGDRVGSNQEIVEKQSDYVPVAYGLGRFTPPETYTIFRAITCQSPTVRRRKKQSRDSREGSAHRRSPRSPPSKQSRDSREDPLRLGQGGGVRGSGKQSRDSRERVGQAVEAAVDHHHLCEAIKR